MCTTAAAPPLAELTLIVAKLEVSEVACQEVILSVTRESPQLSNTLYSALQHSSEVVGGGLGELQWILSAEGTLTQRTTPACEPVTMGTCCIRVSKM